MQTGGFDDGLLEGVHSIALHATTLTPRLEQQANSIAPVKPSVQSRVWSSADGFLLRPDADDIPSDMPDVRSGSVPATETAPMTHALPVSIWRTSVFIRLLTSLANSKLAGETLLTVTSII